MPQALKLAKELKKTSDGFHLNQPCQHWGLVDLEEVSFCWADHRHVRGDGNTPESFVWRSHCNDIWWIRSFKELHRSKLKDIRPEWMEWLKCHECQVESCWRENRTSHLVGVIHQRIWLQCDLNKLFLAGDALVSMCLAATSTQHSPPPWTPPHTRIVVCTTGFTSNRG